MRHVAIWVLRLVAVFQITLVVSHWLTLFGFLRTLGEQDIFAAVPMVAVVSVWSNALAAAICLCLSEVVLRAKRPAANRDAKLS